MRRFGLFTAILSLFMAAPVLAQTSISGLPAATAPTGTEMLPVVQSGQTRRTTISAILNTTGSTVYQPLDSDLTSIAALTTTSTGRTLLTAADAAAIRTQAGLVIGTNVQAYDADLTTYAGITPSANVQTLLGSASFSAFRTSLGVAIGSDVQAYHANLAQLAGLSLIADRLPYANGTGTLSLTTFTSFGRSLVDDADATAARTTIGVTATGADTTYAYRANNLSDLASATTARTNLGLAIGTNVQAFDTELSALAGTTSAASTVPYYTGSGTASTVTFTPGAWTTWTPTVSASTPAGSGFAYTINSATYAKHGRIVVATARVTITNIGTGPAATGGVTLTLPFTAANTTTGVGRENALTGNMLQANVSGGSNLATVVTYSNASPIATNAEVRMTIVYESDS